jgi:hypothetical protein
LSSHTDEQASEREIRKEWIVQVLNNPVALVDSDYHYSTNYYGFIGGRNPLLKVAISKADDQTIATVHFDSGATRRYERGEL